MAICRDPRLTYLNQEGYNVVRLPRQGIHCLGVLGRDGKSLNYLGTLDQIWTSSGSLPVPGAPQHVLNLNGETTEDIKVSIGLQLLTNAIAGMLGAPAPDISVAYKTAKTLQFKFVDVQSVSMDPFLVGAYLAAGDLMTENPFVTRYFDTANMEAFVITELLQSKSINVVAKQDGGVETAVDVQNLQQLLGVKVGVTSANSNNTELTYSGSDYLVFGFKVFGISFADGNWQVHGVDPYAGLAFGGSTLSDKTLSEPVVLMNGLIDLVVDMPLASAA